MMIMHKAEATFDNESFVVIKHYYNPYCCQRDHLGTASSSVDNIQPQGVSVFLSLKQNKGDITG